MSLSHRGRAIVAVSQGLVLTDWGDAGQHYLSIYLSIDRSIYLSIYRYIYVYIYDIGARCCMQVNQFAEYLRQLEAVSGKLVR